MDLGPHAAFIWTSYGIVVVVLAGLLVWLYLDGRHYQRRLEDLEARGIGRRASSSPDS